MIGEYLTPIGKFFHHDYKHVPFKSRRVNVISCCFTDLRRYLGLKSVLLSDFSIKKLVHPSNMPYGKNGNQHTV